MAASLASIRGWVTQAKQNPDYTHVIVVCDTYDWEDYPVNVEKAETVQERVAYYSKNMQRVMEVYNLSLDLESQFREHRAMNF